ncbi:ferredoxin--NADP reductase [Xanthomonas hortorum pv. vitians]|uniref:ferredoxin--NADP(+) reductase n=2 Tax=Xanthomonas hortorum pv. vitians TaxID=83224 RepID=A0AAW8ZR52_9XANT|nr:ferredoxin--NADP reductase [Xanthomonas hortorum]ASW46989.1 ferredoxin--NADP(+) reductase [Xanthomonas hortorum]MCC8492363.1 ferredoxin--NADP reductase [Xanthomonas hortorum pv. gardneri]MCE4282024.1 ferredoxin--NADP reductase [Xanthomonas hortorum pv. vitians]MCE4286577.1 ferredoxin--NADP reductase [Xanthomonas hortorum pv. vitians]MCE4291112.1 ferredoxin--NADP reductase [Xanthomonas hortorum pv. vitians]
MQAVIIEARGGKPRSQTVLNTFVPVQFPLKLVDRRMIAPTVAHCQFLRDDGQPLDFQPGQFIQIHFSGADGTPTKRSYSLATIHDHAFGPGEAVDIAVSFVPGGTATALFEGLQIGDQLQASGPYGRFCLPPGDHNRRYVLIATGTGVTPYRSMLPLLAEAIASRGVQVVLLQGARTPVELLYGDDFRAFADAHPQFRYVPCFSRELPDQPHADVRHGYVQQQLAEFAPDAQGDIAYLCGNPDMVDSCIEALKAAGLPNAQIRREKYVSPAPSKT